MYVLLLVKHAHDTQPNPYLRRKMNYLGWICVGGIVAAIVLIRTQQYRLLYFPQFGFHEPRMATPEEYGRRNWRKVDLKVNDKITLCAYFMMWPHEGRTTGEAWRNVPTILYLHGNAGNMGHRLPIAFSLQESVRCNVVLLAYRGYRGSTQVPPSEGGLIEDAVTALKWLSESGVDTNKIFVMGTSLGAAVTVGAAAKAPVMIKGLILENTFTTIGDVAEDILRKAITQATRRVELNREAATTTPLRSSYTFILYFLACLTTMWKALRPVLLSLDWNTIQRVRTIPEQQHVLFLSGAKDELIPVKHMNTLYSECSSKQKKFVSFPHGYHNDTFCQPGWASEVSAWVHNCLER